MAYPRVVSRPVAPAGPRLPGQVPIRTAPGTRFVSLGEYGEYGDDGLGFNLGKSLKKAAKGFEKHVTRPIGKGVKHAAVQVAKHPLEAAAIAAGAGFLTPFAAPVIGKVARVAARVPGVSRVAHGVEAVGRGIAHIPGVSAVGHVLKPVGKVAASPFILGEKAGSALLHRITGPSSSAVKSPARRVAAPVSPLPLPTSGDMPTSIAQAIDYTAPAVEPGSVAASAPMVSPAPAPSSVPADAQAIYDTRQTAAAVANDASARLATLEAGLVDLKAQKDAGTAPGGIDGLISSIQDKIQAVKDTAEKAGRIVNAADQGIANAQAAASGQPLPYPDAPKVDQSSVSSILQNPYVWGGGLLVLYLLTQKGGRSSGSPRRLSR